MHPLLRACADRQLGLFTTSDARRAGCLQEEVDSLCRSGRWVRLRRGVHVTADDLAEHEQAGRRHHIDCLAVLLALDRPAAAVSHTSAARLWGFPVHRDLDRIVRLTDPGEWRRGRGFVVTSAPLEQSERAVAGPVRLTSAARTLVDCARRWRLEDSVVAMDAALLAGHVDRSDLDAAVARADRWPGAAGARRAVGLVDGRAESPLETRGRLRIAGAGIPLPELQVEIRAAGRLLGVVDAWFDSAALAVEFDGRIKYTDPWRGRTPERVLWDEKRREDEMRAFGVRFLRVAEADLQRWPVIEQRLRRLLAEPGPLGRRFTATPRQQGRRRAG